MGHVTHLSEGNGKFNFISKGKIVYYEGEEKKTSDGLEGHVLAIDIEDANYEGKEYENIVLYMTDSSNDEFVLKFPIESGYGKAFCKMARNVDWKKPLSISAKSEKKEGFSFALTSMFIKQPNESGKMVNVKWFYTKDNPGKLPPSEKKKDRNGEYNDYTKQNAFLRELIVKVVYPSVKKAWPDVSAEDKKKNAKKVDPATITEPIDDLPF